jgi:hypothetical protein
LFISEMFISIIYFSSRYEGAGIVMGYRLDGWGSILSRGKRFFYSASCPMCAGGSLPGGRVAGG